MLDDNFTGRSMFTSVYQAAEMLDANLVEEKLDHVIGSNGVLKQTWNPYWREYTNGSLTSVETTISILLLLFPSKLPVSNKLMHACANVRVNICLYRYIFLYSVFPMHVNFGLWSSRIWCSSRIWYTKKNVCLNQSTKFVCYRIIKRKEFFASINKTFT